MSHRHVGLSRKLALAAMASATAVAIALPAVAQADPEPAPPAPGNTFLPAPPPADPNAPPAPPAAEAPAPAPPADANAPAPPPPDANAPAPPADANAPAPPADANAPAPPPPAPEPGRVDNAAGGFSYVVPEGWKVSDGTQLSYGQALLTKIPPEGTADPPNDTSVLLGRLDLKLFAGAEADNSKAAVRLASDMGEFFMPFPGTRIDQESVPLDANGLPGVASYYEVNFTDPNKPDGQIWAGVVGAATPPGTPRGQRAPERWFVVWLGSAGHPVDKDAAVALANSIRPWTPPAPEAPPAPPADPNAPPPPPADPNAPPPPPADPNAPPAPPARAGVGVPVPVTDAPPEMLPPS